MMTAATLNQAQGARRLTYVQNPHNNLANLVFCYLLFTDREVKVPGKFGDLSKVTCASQSRRASPKYPNSNRILPNPSARPPCVSSLPPFLLSPSACSCDRPYRTSTSSSIAPELIQDKVYRSYAEGKEKEKPLEIATLCLLSIHFLPCTHSLGFTPAPAEK